MKRREFGLVLGAGLVAGLAPKEAQAVCEGPLDRLVWDRMTVREPTAFLEALRGYVGAGTIRFEAPDGTLWGRKLRPVRFDGRYWSGSRLGNFLRLTWECHKRHVGIGHYGAFRVEGLERKYGQKGLPPVSEVPRVVIEL